MRVLNAALIYAASAFFLQATVRWHTVGGKAHLLGGVEVLHRFQQADAAHLEQVVGVLPASPKTAGSR